MVVAGQWRQTGWGGDDDVKGATQSMIKRGGNAGRERAIQQSAGATRDGGTLREEAMQQPTSMREAQRKERDGGTTKEGRSGMANRLHRQHDKKRCGTTASNIN